MKRLAIPLLLLALAGCQEATAPERGLATPSSIAADRFGGCCLDAPDVPPPPAIDTMSATGGGGEFGTVNVQYLLTKTENLGFLSFRDQQDAGITATPGARIMYRKGVYSGRGTLTIRSLTIDLSSVSQTSQFNGGGTDAPLFLVRYDRAYQLIDGKQVLVEGGATSVPARKGGDEVCLNCEIGLIGR